MVLNFSSTGEYAQAVYGDTNSQHAGANGAIAMNNPNSTAGPMMQGGRNQSRRNQSRRNQSRRNQQGGKRRQQSQRRQQRQRRQQSQRRQQRQRGGK